VVAVSRKHRLSFEFGAFVGACVVVVVAPAQDHGRVGCTMLVHGLKLQVRQVARQTPAAEDHLLRVWRVSQDCLRDAPVAALSMPFEVPTVLREHAPGRLLVGGVTRLGVGYLAEVEVAATVTSVSLTLRSSAAQGPGVVFSHLALGSEGNLYALEFDGPGIHAAPWSSGPLPVLTQVASAPAGVLHLESAAAPLPGVLLRHGLEVTGASNFWLRPNSGGASSGAWQMSPVAGASIRFTGVGIEWPGYQAVDAPVLVSGPAGMATLHEVETGQAIGWATIPGPGHVVPFALTQPMTVGFCYEPSVGSVTGSTFWPTFRVGSNTSVDFHKMGLGEFDQAAFRAGNASFSVRSRVQRFDAYPDLPGPTLSFLWAKLGEPGPGMTITLPGGEVILAQPDATFGPSPRDGAMVDMQNLIGFPFPLDQAGSFVGQSILFQILHVLPTGNIVITDVFGGRLLPSAGLQSSAAAVGASTSCLTWLRAQSGACPPWQAVLLRWRAVRSLLGVQSFRWP
jgi:hypothetical protein